MDKKQALKALEEDHKRHIDEAASILKSIKDLMLIIFTEETGVKPGSLVLNKLDDEIYMVVEVYDARNGWLLGVPRKADGDWSMKTVRIHKWEKVQ